MGFKRFDRSEVFCDVLKYFEAFSYVRECYEWFHKVLKRSLKF